MEGVVLQGLARGQDGLESLLVRTGRAGGISACETTVWFCSLAHSPLPPAH